MKKVLILLLFLSFIPIKLSAAEAEIVMDMDSGRILHAKNINDKHLIASTTKIMTATIALENAKLKEKYTVGNEIKQVYGSSMYLTVGEKITLKQLLYGLLLRSGNDAAIVISNNVCKNEKDFVSLMNKKAKELKMSNTIFSNPHGLDEKTKNISTAYDMALLTKYAMKNKEYRKITSTKKISFKTNKRDYTLYNKNRLLITYKPCTGGKTGYTTKARRTLVTTASKNNLDLVIVTIEDENKFSTHEALYNKYYKEYKNYKVLDKYTFSVKGKNKYSSYHLYIKNDLFLPLKKEEKDNLELNIILEDKKKIKDNTKVGYAQIKYKENILGKRAIYASKKENENSFWYKLFR